MKKIIIECSQKHTYRKVVEVEDSDYEVLMKLETLDDVGMWNKPEEFQLLEDMIDTHGDLHEVEQEFTDVTVVDTREEVK